MAVHEVKSEDEFDELVKGLKPESILAVNFYTTWAAPCAQMNGIFAELSTHFPAVKFVSVNAEEMAEVSEAYDVSAVPYVVLVRSNQILARLSGTDPKSLQDALQKETGSKPLPPPLATTAPAQTAASPSNGTDTNGVTKQEEDLETRLGSLVSASTVMLFMKGTPAAPQCGFSRQLVGLLRERGTRYGFFNILADEDVRQGLKDYSDWPTFPQLYVKGELVGGLEIVRQMMDDGEWDELISDS